MGGDGEAGKGGGASLFCHSWDVPLFQLFHGESQCLPSLTAVSKLALCLEMFTSQFLVFPLLSF